jgi:ribosome-binding factor A
MKGEGHHASHLHQALAESIEFAVDFPPGMLVTLVHAEITGDARYAKGVVSVLPESESERAIRMLQNAAPEIKAALNKRLRLRRLPAIQWDLDHTEVKAAEIEKVMNELKKKGDL